MAETTTATTTFTTTITKLLLLLLLLLLMQRPNEFHTESDHTIWWTGTPNNCLLYIHWDSIPQLWYCGKDDFSHDPIIQGRLSDWQSCPLGLYSRLQGARCLENSDLKFFSIKMC